MSAINIKRLKSGEDLIFIVKHGNESIEINEDKAEYVCRTLALFMGLSIVDQRENIKKMSILIDKQESKEEQIGA